MRVLLLDLNPLDYTHRPVHPYGLEMIATRLKQELPSAQVQITNPFLYPNPKEYIARTIADFQPSIIGITLRNIENGLFYCDYFSQNRLGTHVYIDSIKGIVDEIKMKTNVPMVIGGGGYSCAPEEFLGELSVPIGIVGPGEESFCKLCNLINDNQFQLDDIRKNLHEFPGVVISEEEGLCTSPVISNDISVAPNIERSSEYDLFPKFFPDFSMPIRFSTGCSKRCSFCTEHINLGKVIFRDTDEIIEEIKYVNEECGVNNIWLTCSEINLPNDKPLIRLCEKIIEHNLQHNSFASYFFPQPFSEDLFKLLKQAGFKNIVFSANHFNDAVLQRNAVGITKREILKTVEVACQDSSYPISFAIVFGQPGETEETIEDVFTTIKFIDEKFINGIEVNYYAGVLLYPNTPLSNYTLGKIASNEHVISHGKDYIDSALYSTPYPPTELMKLLQNKVENLDLKGVCRVMNTETIEDPNVIDLYRALAFLSVKKSEEGKQLYRKAREVLSSDPGYSTLFNNFERLYKWST